MKRTIHHFLALITTLAIARQASADPTLYAAYQGLFSTVGILRVDARTLQPLTSINTSVEPSAVSIYQGSLYDVEGNTVYRRDPTTGAVLAQNSTLTGIAGMATDPNGIVILVNAATSGPNNTTIYTPSYNLLNSQTLAVHSSNLLYLLPDGSTYTGSLTSPAEQNPYSIATPFMLASAGNRLTRTVINNLAFSGAPLPTEIGPDDSATFGTLGPIAIGAGYIWSAFSGALGTGIFASDINLNPLIQYGFTTSAAIGGIAFQNSSLYYSALNILYRRSPLSGQTLAQSAALPDIFGSMAVEPDTPGDVNFDGHVNVHDVSDMEAALANPTAYMISHSISADDLLIAGDVNGDGLFNNADLQALLDYLNAGGGSLTPVPEPSTLLLLALSGLSCLAFSKRSSPSA